jgi:hypothetical protein
MFMTINCCKIEKKYVWVKKDFIKLLRGFNICKLEIKGSR